MIESGSRVNGSTSSCSDLRTASTLSASSAIVARSPSLQQVVVASSTHSPSTASSNVVLTVTRAMDGSQQAQQASNQQSSQAQQQTAHSTAAVTLMSSSAGTIVSMAPSTMATIAGFTQNQMQHSSHNASGVNILSSGHQLQPAFQTQGLSNMGQFQVIQGGAQLQPNFQFQPFMQQNAMTMLPNGQLLQNMQFGGNYVVAPNQLSLTSNAKLPIVSKGIPLTTSQLHSNLKSAGQQILRPQMQLQQPFGGQGQQTVLISNLGNLGSLGNFVQQQPNILPSTAKTIDQKGKTFTIGGAIQPKTPMMTSNAQLKTNGNQLVFQNTYVPSAPLLGPQLNTQLPPGLAWNTQTPMYIQTSAQHMPIGVPSINVAQNAPTVQVLPQQGTQQQQQQTIQTGHVVQPVQTSAAPTAPAASTSTSLAATTTTTTPKQIKPRPPSSTAGTQTNAAANANKNALMAADSSRNAVPSKLKAVVPKSSPAQLQPQHQQQQGGLPNQPAKPNASMNTQQTPQKPNTQPTVKQSPVATHNANSNQQHASRQDNSNKSTPINNKVSTGTDAITSSFQHHAKSDARGELPLKQSNRTSLTANSASDRMTPASKTTADKVPSNRRLIEKRDASTQEVDLLKSHMKQGDTNGSARGQRQSLENGSAVSSGKVGRDGKKTLTHVIGDYIIEESSNPFPVEPTDMSGEFVEPPFENGRISEIENLSDKVNGSPAPSATATANNRRRKANVDAALHCENCGKSMPKSKNRVKNGNRYCVTCRSSDAKIAVFNPVKSNSSDLDASENNSRSSVDTDRTSHSESSDVSESKKSRKSAASSLDSLPPVNKFEPNSRLNGSAAAVAPSSVADANGPSGMIRHTTLDVYIPQSGTNVEKWNVTDVYDFILYLPGCKEYAEEFRSQEIDGQALMLLKEDHLMSAMGMKLGPALKVCSKINALRDS